MKKILFIVLLFLGTLSTAHATVGGDRLIGSFTYNKQDESVYYAQQDFGGRGCPPELFKLSLVSGKSELVIPCRDDVNDASKKIEEATSGFKMLSPLNFKINDITLDLSFVRSEQYSPEIDQILKSHFKATVYQDGNKIADFPVEGCSATQPFTFQGYSIPGFDKKMVVLVSAKGDCFEGGYIYETLHVVGGVLLSDKTPVTFYKGVSPLLPNEGNYVLFAHTADTTNTPEQYGRFIKPSFAPPAWIFGLVWIFLYILIALSFGRVIYLFFKKELPFVVLLPFILNLVFNFLFTYIQFGLKNNILATVDILLVLGTLVWAMIAIYPRTRLITYVQIPYFLWVSFATVLQITITYLNR